MRVHVVDPPAYTPPYDRALCAALAAAGAEVELVTSRFPYGDVPAAAGYEVREAFYRLGTGLAAGGRARRAARLAQHVPDMLRYRRAAAREADVAHFQWLTVQHLDGRLLPRRVPVVLTAHDVLPREPRPGQREAQRGLYERVDAVVVHSEHGRGRLIEEAGVDPEKVRVIPHGPLDHLARVPDPQPLPPELAAVDKPVVLLFGLMRPYKGLDVAIDAWQGIADAELWIVGLARMWIEGLREVAPPTVRFLEGYVPDAQVAAYFRRADLAILPYREIDQSGVLYTALAFGTPLVLGAVGGFPEVAATGAAELVPPGDAPALRETVRRLLADPAARGRLAAAGRAAAEGPYAWPAIARAHLDLYAALRESPRWAC
ncbi:MAG TPA: glycosyltransferase family 4 protein [Solirubrobacteraceae bacterium]|nr:glycosyltransferase family 4 protein [Solirubrobacteraceae bacterium]